MSFNHFLVFSLSLFLVSQAKEDRWTVFLLFLLVVLVEWQMGSSVAFSSLSTYVVHIKQSDRSSVVFTLNPLKNDKTHFAHYVVSRWAAVATYFFLMIFCHTGN